MFIDRTAAETAPHRFADPLDCLAAAHEAQRAMCDALEEFCADPDLWRRTPLAAALHARLGRELALHAGDEDEVLLPLLCRRGIVAADGATLAMAASQHARDRRLLHGLLPELGRLARGEAAGDAILLTTRGIAFAHAYRKHVAFEERDLMDPATALDAADRRAALAAMAARRRLH